MKLYRGYILTKDKQSVMKFKNVPDDELYTLKQVKNAPEYAGVLAAETILIDIDDMKQSDILFNIVQDLNIKCNVTKTSRGKHFVFKNSTVDSCKTHCNLVCGLKADIKVGVKNCYQILKVDGVERETLRSFPDDEIDILPPFLLPVTFAQPFLNMSEGEGRNNALFAYILPLQGLGLTVDEIKQSITIINEYILEDPLSDEELSVILRPEAFEKPVFFKGKTFEFDKFATYIKNNNHIIKINGQLHVYKDGIYVSGRNEIEAVMIKYISNLSRAKRSEVFDYLDILIMENTPIAPPNLICFKNGIYDINTDTLQPCSPDIVLTNRIPWDYNENAYSELADKTLDKMACHDPNIRQLLNECIGSMFYRSNTLGGGKCFILTGSGANGKSTYLDMLKMLIDESNYSSLDLKELDAKFQNAELFGKLANIGDDISDEFIVNASVFKKLVTGNTIQVQRKGERPFEFKSFAKQVFSANNMPRIRDRTGAVLRRLLIIPFNASFSEDDPDYDEQIGFKLQTQEVMEYLIQCGLDGLTDVLNNHKYSESAKVKKELEEYEIMNNPIKAFLNDCDDAGISFINQPIKDIYKQYDVFCAENNYQRSARGEFTKQVKRLKHLDSKQKRMPGTGEVIRIFIEAGDENE